MIVIIINVAKTWEHSSAGRAPALQAGGHRFEPCCSHHYGRVVQLVRTPACHAGGRGFEPLLGRHYAQIAQLVEQRTENPRVAGSIPALGTMVCGFSSSGRAPPCQGGGSEFEPRKPLQNECCHSCGNILIWWHSQVVRQRSAKPRFPSSNLGATSKKKSADVSWRIFVCLVII